MKILLQLFLVCLVIALFGGLASGAGVPTVVIAPACAILVVGGLIGYYVWLGRKNDKEWNARQERLCANCLIVAKPFRNENNAYYCPHCQADNPVPLDSPFAREYFARQQRA